MSPPVLVAAADEAAVRRGLAAPYSAFCEAGADFASERCRAAVAAGGLALSLTTAAAFALDTTELFAAAVAARFPGRGPGLDLIALALGEAVANAVVHGNLGINSSLRATAKGFEAYRNAVRERLADPVHAGRRIELCAVPTAAGGLTVTVTDQGAGFDAARQLAKPVEAAAKSGRGLALIRKTARLVWGEDGGRTLALGF